jgi:hypothetical protein
MCDRPRTNQADTHAEHKKDPMVLHTLDKDLVH